MPTTAEITQRYVQAHADIANAITAKGGTVSAGDGFEEFPADIATIPSGSTTDFRLPLNGGVAKPCANNGIVINMSWASHMPQVPSGRTNALYGRNIWTDGDDIYYSSSNTQYIYNKSTHSWSAKTWTGLTGFSGSRIWTDGDNIYYSEVVSNVSQQYVLDKSTSTWSAMTWNGFSDIRGNHVWTDGDDIYYSYNSDQYVLDKTTHTWSAKTWTGLTDFQGDDIWTDGNNIYHSNGSSNTQYVLNKATSTWSTKTWSGIINLIGAFIWTDGINIYHSYTTNQHILRLSDTWETISWAINPDGSQIWTDGEDIYSYTAEDGMYKLTITKTDTTNINAPSARG